MGGSSASLAHTCGMAFDAPSNPKADEYSESPQARPGQSTQLYAHNRRDLSFFFLGCRLKEHFQGNLKECCCRAFEIDLFEHLNFTIRSPTKPCEKKNCEDLLPVRVGRLLPATREEELKAALSTRSPFLQLLASSSTA